MKPFPYSLLCYLFLFPLFSNATTTARLILAITNEYKNPVTLQAGDWLYQVEPGKTVIIDERIDGVSIPYTITFTVRGKLLDGHPESTELRIFDGGTYTGRKARISKEGTVHLQSLAAEMDWLYYTRDITPETVYPLAAVLIDKDPGSPAVSDILASYICRAKFSPDSIEALYTRLNTTQQTSPRGKIVAGYIEARRALIPGKIMADFQLPDSSGKMISLYSIKSRYILIDFWFSTCKPCIEGFPELIDLYNKTSREDLTIIGISVDGPAMLPSWKAAIRKYQLPWINLSDPKYSIPYYRYGIEQYPTQVLVDGEYRIIGVNEGLVEVERILK